MAFFKDLKQVWKSASEAYLEIRKEQRKHRALNFKDCIEPSLCRQCRYFVEQILTKEAFQPSLASKWKFGEFDITLTHRGVLRGPDYAKLDLRQRKCPLCRLLINAWRQLLPEGHKRTFLNELQIHIPLEPSSEFTVSSTVEDARGDVDFVLCSDVPGARWLEEWFSEVNPQQGTATSPGMRNAAEEDIDDDQGLGSTAVSTSTASESSQSSHSDVDPVLLPSQAPEVIAQIRGWLHECVNNHEACSRRVNELLSRVIDVGKNDDSSEPKLYISHGEHVPYITLSYRWGAVSSTVLTRSSLEQFQKAVPKGAMPSTIGDAIPLTRKLGVRYLWVDALCILQGDASDWEIESNKMSKIYEGSHLTIVADEANSRHAGLCQERSVRVTSKPLPV